VLRIIYGVAALRLTHVEYELISHALCSRYKQKLLNYFTCAFNIRRSYEML